MLDPNPPVHIFNMRFSVAFISWLLPTTALATSNSRVFKRANDTDYILKKGPLDTPWTEKVGTNPWPEYPRPQLQRSDWKNLNGVWRYKNASAGDDKSPPSGVVLPEPVLVPFCLESALSGIDPSDSISSSAYSHFDRCNG